MTYFSFSGYRLWHFDLDAIIFSESDIAKQNLLYWLAFVNMCVIIDVLLVFLLLLVFLCHFVVVVDVMLKMFPGSSKSQLVLKPKC